MVYVLLGTGFEETEAVAPIDLLRRVEIPVTTVGIGGKRIVGSHGIALEADITLDALDREALEMIVLPGGLGGVASIRGSQEALDIISQAWERGKYVAAICAGPTILADLGITRGRRATCYPGCEDAMGDTRMECSAAVIDGRLITGTSAGCAIPFGLALIEALKGRELANTIAQQIVMR